MKRYTMILSAILVFQVALAAFTLWPRSATGSAAAAPLFANLTATDIVSLTFYDKPDAGFTLKKQGDRWVLPDAGDFPADGSKVSALLDKLVGLKTNRLVTRTEASQARLKVSPNDYLHRVDFQTADGTNHTLYVGSSTGARATHVRSGDRLDVYLADDLNASDASAQPGSWIDPVYLSVTTTDVTGFTLKNANGEWTFNKDQGGSWTMDGLAAGETLSQENINSLIGQVVTLRMTRPLGKTAKPEYGLDKPGAELTIRTKKDNQEQTHTLQVGNAADADATYVVKSGDSPYYVRVSEYSVKDLIEKKRDGFLQAPPTPAVPAGAPTPAS